MLMDTIKYHPDTILKSNPCKIIRDKLVVIGASTGGVDALSYIFSRLPAQLPPIAVVQHIPPSFGSSFIKRLDTLSQLSICEVTSKTPMKDNCVYIAGGDKHMIIDFAMGSYYAKSLDEKLRISRHKPSVDILFRSANNTAGRSALGIILTGMGDDGCIGLKELYDNGAHTLAENEKDCIVFGMPKKAIEMGAVSEILSLDAIIKRIIDYANTPLKALIKEGSDSISPPPPPANELNL
ncbi:chemotaxis protein CheB [Helicobacter sp. MIT 03-1614]|uniref:protein-glutamate methylesterase n=1 Tax=Helicobacter hepaticus (strain ATCC 51449 / 3B1) TaxID=235279 RepID=Q7VIZ6_HELHP|nr:MULTISPECIES: CheB methylesterase domain-containing protein [Helicobacter]AAP77053.1 chemotaxis protein methylesterase CheB [Helicobacter hepaticus ATCC 51449]TLD89595.1 chemotaxis protein CheB [Helicobacter sp. MIT 03-1614]